MAILILFSRTKKIYMTSIAKLTDSLMLPEQYEERGVFMMCLWFADKRKKCVPGAPVLWRRAHADGLYFVGWLEVWTGAPYVLALFLLSFFLLFMCSKVFLCLFAQVSLFDGILIHITKRGLWIWMVCIQQVSINILL